jgi:hypothetical protein
VREISFDDGGDAPRTMWQYPREYIDMLRELADTVGIIGRDVNLKQSGNGRWMGVCPFHDDHNPSFSVSQRGYKCFGCDAKGDIINFLMSHDGMTFGEAIRHLQQLTGLTPPNKRDALERVWKIPDVVDDVDIMDDESSIDRMMWEIANQCRGVLRYQAKESEPYVDSYGWEVPIVYQRIMTIFRVADEALERDDPMVLRDIINRIGAGMLSWRRISNEQGRETGGPG